MHTLQLNGLKLAKQRKTQKPLHGALPAQRSLRVNMQLQSTMAMACNVIRPALRCHE